MKTLRHLFLLLFLTASIGLINSCGGDDAVPETCSDNIQNQDETGVDCGGVCSACVSCTDGIQNQDETGIDCGGADCDPCPTCSDNILNQGELGTDCGGPCPACFSERMTAEINGVAFAANLVAGSEVDMRIDFQSDQSQERQLFFKVPSDIVVGTYDLTSMGYEVRYAKLFEGEYTTESGSIIITRHDPSVNELEGTFEFTSVQYDFGVPVDTVVVTGGDFGVEYF